MNSPSAFEPEGSSPCSQPSVNWNLYYINYLQLSYKYYPNAISSRNGLCSLPNMKNKFDKYFKFHGSNVSIHEEGPSTEEIYQGRSRTNADLLRKIHVTLHISHIPS
jgi:hypothetical protein